MGFKIYTKTGDDGGTALFGGRRVSKSDLRVDAYGTVDELNAFIGLLRDNVEDELTKSVLKQIQDRLFTTGAHLASDPEKQPPTPDLYPEDIALLETEMDRMDATLPALKHFILPGGFLPASQAHVCRTVCRRAERLIVALHHIEPVDPLVIQYCNRLSDYFFMLARHLSHEAGIEEIIWNPRKKD